jgi:hypothetical protein
MSFCYIVRQRMVCRVISPLLSILPLHRFSPLRLVLFLMQNYLHFVSLTRRPCHVCRHNSVSGADLEKQATTLILEGGKWGGGF